MSLDKKGNLLLSGWLKPDGIFIHCGYMEHKYWASDECERLQIEYTLSAVDKLIEKGYIQISAGYAFLFDSNKMGFMKITKDQYDWLLINKDKLDKDTNRAIEERYS